MRSEYLLSTMLISAAASQILAGSDPCPVSTSFVGEYRTPATANQVQIEDAIAYVVDWFPNTSLQIIDISDPASPSLLGSFSTSTSPIGFAVENGIVYLPSGSLRIIDATDPAIPEIVGFYGTGGPVRDVVVKDATAYIAKSEAFQIVDVSDPTSPTLVGTSGTMLAAAEFVAVVDNTAYVTDFTEGVLQIFDISDPTTPTIVGSYTGFSFPSDIAAAGTNVFVTDFTGFHIIDASVPSAPVSASFTSIGIARGITVDGNTAYIAGGQGLEVFDVSDITAPVSIGSYDAPQASRGIALSSNNAYLACEGFGLQIVSVQSTCAECPADFTGEGELDIFDVLAFIEAFNASDPSADFTGEGAYDIFDVLGFVEAFNSGCP